MAIVQVDIDFSKPLTEEQIKELEALKDRPITFDDDCPELTPEQLKRFVCIREICKGNFVTVSGEKLSRLEAEKYLTHVKHLGRLNDNEYASLLAKLPPEDPGSNT